MKHAYLIAAHHQIQLLYILLQLIDDERNEIYLHVDKKCKEFNETDLKNVIHKAKIHLLERRTVTWGGYSQIQLELDLLKESTLTHHDIYHLISGVDLPLKSQDEIYRFFDTHKGMQVVSYDYHTDMKDVTNRMAYYRMFQDVYGNKKSFLFKIDALFVKLQKAMRINRIKDDGETIKKGANWFSITHEFAKYVISKESDIRKRYRFTRCCDEIFLQTLLYNSIYSSKVYFDNEAGRCYNMRYVDFQRGNPYVFKISDKSFLNSRRELFARKFDYEVDKNIIFAIQEEITNKERGSIYE